jgi:hypothetical protein
MNVRGQLKSVPGLVPLVRWLRGPTPVPVHGHYWERRKHLLYYREVLRLAKRHCPAAHTVIDIGAKQNPFVLQLDWIAHKTRLDIEPAPALPGCLTIQADFMEYCIGEPVDLALCLQVLEHLENPGPFARKLLEVGRTVILSVPYRWPKGLVPSHRQDPVDEDQLRQWTGRPWIDVQIMHGLAFGRPEAIARTASKRFIEKR